MRSLIAGCLSICLLVSSVSPAMAQAVTVPVEIGRALVTSANTGKYVAESLKAITEIYQGAY
uniref:hypothetical protein n=1 Tax=Candidatus Avelusimicrobium luingense TaxID=3416211 RepID=UPI003D11B620